MEPQGRFMYDTKPSKEAELQRITRLSEHYQPIMEKLFNRCKAESLQRGHTIRTIIDIGAGTGHTSILLKKVFPDSRVTYFDPSLELTSVARELAQKQNCTISFTNGDIHSHPFEEHFDLVFSRFALKHLYDPPLAIQKMVEILEPGGCILLMDKDVTANTWYPTFPLYRTKFMTALNQLNRQPHRGGDSSIGRKIKYYLHQSHIRDIRVEVLRTHLTDPENAEYRKLYLGVYINLLPELVEAGLISREDGLRDIDRLHQFLENPQNLAVTMDFIVKGTKK